MKRYPDQFQNGFNLNEIFKYCGSEEQCFEALFNMRWPQGFQCPNCGHDRICNLNTRKLRQCYRCHRQSLVIAGTIFASSMPPLTIWFQAIYLLAQSLQGIAAMLLHRQLGISYDAAWRREHKLMQVRLERSTSRSLSRTIQMTIIVARMDGKQLKYEELIDGRTF